MTPTTDVLAGTRLVGERPILLKPALYDATVAGRKTQTRRIIKPQPRLGASPRQALDTGRWAWRSSGGVRGEWFSCPYGVPGDRLYVKEKLVRLGNYAAYARDDEYVQLACTRPSHLARWGNIATGQDWTRDWLSPMHMPKWAARLWLEITGVRVERVQDISEDDALAEGACREYLTCGQWDEIPNAPKRHFARLWDSINAKRGYPWESNPWVWAITFKAVTT